MERNRTSFVWFESYSLELSKLKDPIAELKYYRAIQNYALYGTEPEIDNNNGFELAFWEGLKLTIDRNKKKYQKVKEKQSAGGKKHSGNQYTRKAAQEVQGSEDEEPTPEEQPINGFTGLPEPEDKKPLGFSDAQKMEDSSKKWKIVPKNGTVGTDNVNDNVNVNENVTFKEKKRKYEDSLLLKYKGIYNPHHILKFADHYAKPSTRDPNRFAIEFYKDWNEEQTIRNFVPDGEPSKREWIEQEEERQRESDQRHEQALKDKANAKPMPEEMERKYGLIK